MGRKVILLTTFIVICGVPSFGQQSNVQFTPYGYIKFDATNDSARTAYGDLGLWVLPENASGGDKRELTFGARDTRFGLNIIAPESRGVKTTGRLEIDFYEEVPTTNK